MVNRKNRCTTVLTTSGTSCCPDYVNHCCQRRCNITCCRDQCEFINDRTYMTLRKICHKIFKDYNRSQCREKYTIFEGGNSINVRIHRSGSRGDEISKDPKYEKASNEYRYRLQNKHNNIIDQDGRRGKITGKDKSIDPKYERAFNEDRYRLQNKHNISGQDGRGVKITDRKPGRNGEKFDSDVDVYSREQTKRLKGNHFGEDDKNDNVYGKRNKKLESAKGDEGQPNSYNEPYYSEKTLKGKQKISQGIDTINNRNSEHDIIGKTIENRRSKSRKDNVETTYSKKTEAGDVIKRSLRDDKDSDENYIGKAKLSSRDSKKYEKKSRQLKIGATNYKEGNIGTAETAKIKNRKGKNKYSVDIDEDAVVRTYDEVTNTGKYKKGKQPKGYGDDIDNLDITAKGGTKQISSKSKNKMTNKYRKSQGFDDIQNTKKSYHVITNLRKKVRRADNVGLNNGSSFSHIRKLQKIMLQKAEFLQCRQTNPSRVDEVRACDYLRALMEQRELCQCQCSQQSSQFSPHICIPKACMPSCCFSENCES